MIRSHADYYRDTIQVQELKKSSPIMIQRSRMSFTPAARTSFKDKIQDLNRTVLPATTTTADTDDKNNVAVLGFPRWITTIYISHASL